MQTDIIAAIATAMTNSGIGIVRISGEGSLSVIDRIYKSNIGNKKLSQVESHTIHYGFIYDENHIIDEVIVLIMRAPNSYTMEDTVEIDCHGGTLVIKKILETVIKNGARPALPGEFTKRAFLNGRIDLSQAESIIDIINAKNEFALDSSLNQLKGSVLNVIKEIRSKILHEIAFIESALDDPEHVNIDDYGILLEKIVDEVSDRIERLLSSFQNGVLLKEGIRTVIVGKPNAGKSSLLNVLVGKERAIVTDIEGTTRDILEEQINLNGITLNIIDTAGIRNTNDVVEKIGVNKAKEQILNSNLVFYIVDASTYLDENDKKIMKLIDNSKTIIILNKSDLVQVTTKEMLADKFKYKIIEISAKEKTGIETLYQTIQEMFFQNEILFNEEVVITNVRHKFALQESLNSLKIVKISILNDMPEDFYTIDLMDAYKELGTIIGESIDEDLVNEIFSKFCTGK
ncbi:tRNA uridine-5-carboxymethylaminomethyl(34) synthesis GTPase MnmE [Lachnospiraceae bacterium ZAX-1]